MFETIYIKDKSFNELLSLFFCHVEGDSDYYDVVAANIAERHQSQLEAILVALEAEQLRAALTGLGLGGRWHDNFESTIQQYVSHPDEFVVAAAIDSLRLVGRGDLVGFQQLIEHDSPFVRGAALRFGRSRKEAGFLGVLLDALNDSHPIVRSVALDELDGIADASTMKFIEPLLQDPSCNVRQAAETLLNNLQGS